MPHTGIVRVTMVHRGTTRESKNRRAVRQSTIEEKYRRHKNKVRIWRRCVARLAYIQQEV